MSPAQIQTRMFIDLHIKLYTICMIDFSFTVKTLCVFREDDGEASLKSVDDDWIFSTIKEPQKKHNKVKPWEEPIHKQVPQTH